MGPFRFDILNIESEKKRNSPTEGTLKRRALCFLGRIENPRESECRGNDQEKGEEESSNEKSGEEEESSEEQK